MIKEIYVDGILRTDYKTSAVFIDGQIIKDSTKFNIFNRRVLDLDQNSDFAILYTLQVIKDDKRDQQKGDPLNGIQIKDPKRTATTEGDPLNGIQIKDPKKSVTGDPLNGIQIKEPSKNKSSITINGTPSTDATAVRINGKLITDQSNIELYLDGKKVKDSNIIIVIEIKKDNLLKYVRLQKK